MLEGILVMTMVNQLDIDGFDIDISLWQLEQSQLVSFSSRIQDLVFSVKLHFKKKLVKEGCFSPKCFGIKQDLGLKCSAWKVFDSKD